MLFEFTSRSGNRFFATHLTLNKFRQQVNGVDVSEVTFNSLLLELRNAEKTAEMEVRSSASERQRRYRDQIRKWQQKIAKIVIACDCVGNMALYLNGELSDITSSEIGSYEIVEVSDGKPVYVEWVTLNDDFAETFTQHTLGKPDSVVFPLKLQQLEPYFVDDTEPKVELEPRPVEITCPCWVKLRDGNIWYTIRRNDNPEYPWCVCGSGNWHTVAACGVYLIDGGENDADVIQTGEPLTDAEIVAAARGETLEYTGTMLK